MGASLLPALGQVQAACFLPHTGHKPAHASLHSCTVGIWNKNSWKQPLVYIQLPIAVQRQIEIRIIQIPLPDRPFGLDCFLALDRVETASAFAMHRCLCTQSQVNLVALGGRVKTHGHRFEDLRPGEIPRR